MIATDVKFDPVSQQKFGALMREMQELTGAEMWKVTRNSARDYCRFALKLTPLARRLTASDFRDGDGYIINLKHETTGKRVSFVGTRRELNEQKRAGNISYGPGQYPQGRGYARMGWMKALIALGVPIKLKGSKASIDGINHTGDYVNGLKRPVPFVEVANQVPYIEKLDRGGPGTSPHNIMARAMAATAYKMEKTLTKLSRRMAERWNK